MTMTIGQFGRRSGLSIKALRLYEASGLLQPAEVDPASGYRRYAPDQLDRAHRIILLRRLGMPLALIGELLDLPDADAVQRLDRWWAAEDAAIRERRNGYVWLRTRLAHGAEPERHYQPFTTRLRERKLAMIRTAVDQQDLVPMKIRAEWTIRAHLEAQGAQTTAEHWVIYHSAVTPESEGDIEVCVPFTGAADPTGEIAVRMESERLAVSVAVARDDCFYPRILQAYEAVDAFATQAGLVLVAPPREIYLDHYDRLAPADPFVHVTFPVEG